MIKWFLIKTHFFAQSKELQMAFLLFTATSFKQGVFSHKCLVMVFVCLQVPVQSWFDDLTDTELLDLLPLFEGLSKEMDIYSVLQSLRAR